MRNRLFPVALLSVLSLLALALTFINLHRAAIGAVAAGDVRAGYR